MNKLKKIGVFLLSICILGVSFPSEVFAASARVSVSSNSGNVGSTVTISCTASVSGASIGSADVTLSYDPSALSLVPGSCSNGASGGSGGIYFSNYATGAGQSSLSFSMSFQILKEGTFGISVTNYDISDWDEQSVSTTVSGGSVTGKAQTSGGNAGNNSGGTTSSGNTGNTGTTQDNKDSNNKLSSLQISPGSLTPAFNTNTTSYTVNVPEETTEIIISAAAQSNKAKVSVSGGKNLQPGENTAKVVVTAENGATRVYTLTVIRGEVEATQEPEVEPEKIQINGADHTINEAFADDTIPAGFIREKITYNGKEYEALKHEKGDLQLVSLQNDATGAVFYIFNGETQEFYNFVQIQISEGKYIIPLPLKDIKEFKNNKLTVLTLQEKTFDAWMIDDEYSVLLMMNADGEEVIYQYDSVDGTLQRYAGAVAKETVEEEETEETFFSLLEKYHLYVIAGLGGFALVLMITLIYFIATRKHRHQARKRKMQKKLEKQREE